MRLPEQPRSSLPLTPKNRLIPVVACSVSLLLILFSLLLVSTGVRNRKRYQTQNYARYQQNIANFERLLAGADNLCYSLETQSLYGSPFAAAASKEEMEAVLLETGDAPILTEANPFIYGSAGYSLYARLQVLASASSDIAALTLYAPSSGYALGVWDEGRSGWVARSGGQMRQITGIAVSPDELADHALIQNGATSYIKEGLHIVRRLNNGLVLIVGFSDAAVEKNLLYENCGRSYAQNAILLRLPDGAVIARPAAPEESALAPGEVFSGEDGIRIVRGHTVMELNAGSGGYALGVVLTETGATDPASSSLFFPFLLINALWLMIIAAVCIYVSVYMARPLRQYGQQLHDQQTTIDQQRLQLRRAYLFRLMQGENVSSVPTDELESLLRAYALMVIYPENGRWVQGEGSIQELEYQSHIAMFSMRESLGALLSAFSPEFVICGAELVAILAAGDCADEAIWAQAEKGLLAASQQGGQSFRFGISRVHRGAENMEHAYRAARRKMAALSEEDGERSEDVNLSGFLRPNMHMANLIYVEKYAEAWDCFQETLAMLYQQKSRSLRQQQLSSFLSLTLCMLLETSPGNTAILESRGMAQLTDASDRKRLEAAWQSAFAALGEQHEDRRAGQYSAQFTVIYQYVQAHFRNPEISLSLLSEEFGLSLSTLSREFQKNLGEGFLDCLHRMRVDAARHEIEYSRRTIAEVAASVGYSNTLTMTRAFKKYLGVTPGTFRKQSDE